MNTSLTPIIEFKNISKNFGGVRALREVSFAIPPGEIHALVGENGAGKSTLIRICGGIFPPDGGQIRFDGAEVRFRNVQESRKAGISIVHQEIPVCQDLTAAENIFMGHPLPKQRGLIDWAELNRRTRALFDQLQVGINPTAVVKNLPIAQRQIVAIAQALSWRSKLLIMDEPTSALNKHEASHLFEILQQLKSQGLTILYVSHRLEEVFEIADRISALRDGRYIDTLSKATATPEQVVQLMVGREVTDLFPKTFNPPGDMLLQVEQFTAPGLFENVSFELKRGEVLGLVDLQGSGTSEVLRALFGCYRNVTGEIKLHGQKVALRSSLDAIAQGIAYVPADRQAEGLFTVLSVRDNGGLLLLRQLARLFGLIPMGLLRRKIVEMVQRFNIRTSSIFASISSLSGGNQQKVVIGRSLSTGPQVVLLDDPTRGIDVGAKAEVHHILNHLTAQGCGVILVSSELPEVLAMSDRVMVMYRGQMRAILTRTQIDHELVMGLATGADVAVTSSLPVLSAAHQS